MNPAISDRRLADLALSCLAAPLIWFVHLTALYGAETLICLSPDADSAGQFAWATVIATGLGMIGLMALASAFIRGRGNQKDGEGWAFLLAVGLGLVGMSALAMAWNAVPAIMLPVCSAST